MKHEELILNLKQLNLAELARLAEKSKLTFEQFLAAAVKLEVDHRLQKRVARMINAAKIPKDRHIATYDFSCRSGITAQEVNRLAEGNFVRKGDNIVFYGTFGIGKSHLAMGLTRALCEKGFRCLFKSTQDLITELVTAQQTLKLTALFRRLDRYDLIVCDELGFTSTSKEGGELFFRLLSQRYERKSVLITTNLTYSAWDKVFTDPLATAAAVDRFIHQCETFNIQGPSWRAEAAAARRRQKQTEQPEQPAPTH